MHFLDAWTELGAFDLARLLVPLGLLSVAVVLPGRRLARVAAVGVAAFLPSLRELGVTVGIALGWTALWLFPALWPGHAEARPRRPLSTSRGALESGSVGLLLGITLLLMLVTAVARQDMSPEETRRASYGAAWLGLGLLHLMLRRHIRAAVVGFAALGLGLQFLNGAARGAQLQATSPSSAGLLVATSLAIAIALRVAGARERHAATGWVGDAHDLHD